MEGVMSMSNICGGIYYSSNNGYLRNMGMMFLNNDHRKYYGDNKVWSRVVVKCCNKDNMVVIEKGNTKLDNDDKKNNKMVKKQKKMMKKRSKLLKDLSRDIVAAAGLLPDSCDNEGLKLQEASELLLSQLKELRSEQKELKKKMKEDKAKLKAAVNCSSDACSSSSSSESSDSECEREVLDMSRLKLDTSVLLPSPITMNEEGLQQTLPLIMQEKEAPVSAYTLLKSEQDCNNSLLSLLQEKKENNKNTIEVCMGGKCKKSGAGALLEEFQRVVGGADHAVDVIGCKCMGKCRDGPNVRLVSSSSDPYRDCFNENEDRHHHHQQQVAVAASPSSVLMSSSMRTHRSSHPLCIGVGLEDVGLIVSKLVGDTS